MAKVVKNLSRFVGGIAEYETEGTDSSTYAFGRSIDVRTSPNSITLLPRTIKETGTIIEAMPKWGVYTPINSTTYIYDEAGNIYSRTSASVYTKLHTVADSHGNGMAYFAEDGFIYYTSDNKVGRYGPIGSSTPTFVDDFFGSQGGVPLNTSSLDLEADSSQYASRADSASLSITGALTLEAYIKPESLPASNELMTVMSKWDESGTTKSYRLSIGTVSNFFGDGSDGALTISADTTQAPTDSAATGTVDTYTLSATNASFAAGQKILIHQTRGTNAGQRQINEIQSYTAGTITTVEPLNATYTSGAQVIVIPQYTTVTVNTGKTWTAKAWNGTVGGILVGFATTSITGTGSVSAKGKGFRGADQPSAGTGISGKQGESYNGTYNTASTAALYGGGGGGGGSSSAGASAGGGGASAQIGTDGSVTSGSVNGKGGATYGSQDLTATMIFGSGGGSGGNSYNSSSDGGRGGAGGNGGGGIFLAAPTITLTGSFTASGNQGQVADLKHASGGGGGGGGGFILLYTQTATLGTNLCTADGGLFGYNSNGFSIPGGIGGRGRLHIDYLTSYTGTAVALDSVITTTATNPPGYTSSRGSNSILYATEDTELGASDGYALKLDISSDGDTTTTASKPISIVTDKWQHVAAKFDATGYEIELFLDGTSLGTVSTGAISSIHDNASTYQIGMYKDGTGTAAGFFDGLIDEAKVWARAITTAEIALGLKNLINTASSGLKGYWKLEGDYTDASGNSNTLTASGSPVFSTDIPFSAPTARVDIDQSGSGTGDTYALTTAISETTANKQVFTPAKDPQKSIEVSVATKGTGDWTITVHDQFNVEMASKTLTNDELPTSGLIEFTFTTPWRPLTNFTNEYHFHLTSTVADGTVTTTSSNDLSASTFKTYYSFLVNDEYMHPIKQYQQFLCFGNERHIATLEATAYDPNTLTLPSNWRIWSIDYWNEYLATGCIRGTTPTEQDDGMVFLWDGSAPVFNLSIPIPEGGVTGLLGHDGVLDIYAGYQGDILRYEGGQSVRKLRKIPKVTDATATYVYPGAITMWKGLMRFGVAGYSDSTEVNKGVYTYGSSNYKYPEILTYDYPISTKNYTSTGVRVGMVIPVDQELLIGWADATGYGVDYVSDSNNVFETGTIEFMIEDDDTIWKEKQLNTLVTKVKELETGQSIQLKYKIDDDSSWNLGEIANSSSTEPNVARFVVSNGRYFESQVGLDIISTSGTTPTIKGVGIEVENHKTSKRVG